MQKQCNLNVFSKYLFFTTSEQFAHVSNVAPLHPRYHVTASLISHPQLPVSELTPLHPHLQVLISLLDTAKIMSFI